MSQYREYPSYDFSDSPRPRYPQFPHGKHAITALCTCGLWVPFWILFYFIHVMIGGK